VDVEEEAQEAERRRRRGGIQNQKQEPHTKLWGMKAERTKQVIMAEKHAKHAGRHNIHGAERVIVSLGRSDDGRIRHTCHPCHAKRS